MPYSERDPAPARELPFTLYAAHGRVYARNRDQKIIDLGALKRDDGVFRYQLDGNQQAGRGFASAVDALRDIASHLRFLWLDGQFTALADAREDPDLDLDGAAQLDIVLDELAPGERMNDAAV